MKKSWTPKVYRGTLENCWDLCNGLDLAEEAVMAGEEEATHEADEDDDHERDRHFQEQILKE